MTIIFASRLVAYKNLPFVFNAIASIKARRLRPEGAVFTVMGSGPEEQNLLALRRTLGLENEVSMLGSVTEERVRQETENCALALAPALTEFSPNYVLRALALGKPLLVSKENGLSFKLPENFVFEAQDTNDFETKILWLLGHPKEAKSLVKAIHNLPKWQDVILSNVELVKNTLSP